jgi:HK97 family phage major capsid protein
MVSPSNFTAMKKLFSSNMTLQTSASNVGPQHFFDGSLVVQNKNLADTTILFGDWSNYVTVIFKDIEVRLLEHRVVDAHQVSFISFARFGGGLAVPAAIKKATVS